MLRNPCCTSASIFVVLDVSAVLLILKGIVHNFFSFVKSHILGYDGVWYSSFWSEASGNHPN